MKGFLSVCLTALLITPSAYAIPWSYEGNNPPENLGALGTQHQRCKEGAYQFPIDIRGTIEAKLPPLPLHFQSHATNIINNGQTLQLNVDDKDNFSLDGINFTLKQFHFHTPSENTIEGKSFPLEAHFVHSDEKGNLAVLAIMFEVGDKNEALQPIIDYAPTDKNQTLPLDNIIDIASLFPASKHYYRFSGSLTTPPCTEGVRWLVMKDSVSLSLQQLDRFKALLGMHNNRPTQPLNGRMVVQ